MESPGKAKTIKKYLGKDFEVLASYGHVRDLVPKEGAVDTEHHFAMKYQPVERNQKHVDAISRALKKCKALFLATELVLFSPRPGRIARRFRPDFSRRFLAGEPIRAIKGDPQFLAMREELALAILAGEEEGPIHG